MSGSHIGIAGTGYYVPSRVLTNAELEKMVDTTDEWIVERTGIRERRIAGPEETVSSMAALAARRALSRATVRPEDLDLIIVGTFTPDKPLPASACLLQARLGNIRAASFDVSAACCGFIFSLEIADKLMRGSGDYRSTLIVASEKISAVTDWQDRNTCVLFGDGAGAVVLKKNVSRGVILDCFLGSDGSKSSLLEIPGGGSALPFSREVLDKRLQYVRMEGREVFKLAVSSMAEAIRVVLERNQLTEKDIAWLIPHQANMRIMKAVARSARIPFEKVFVNIDRYGNMSGATVPIGLAEMEEQGLLKSGDRILLVAFGGGLTWASALIKW